ncbi:DUF1905 domain-containing protein [Gordonia sp. TBRC 11910]|uniref:DUF1905 domain-containing protein n=1 Tax=Gordonia asplenii TaxID=2725283 RepID=A0A848KZ14_9ACTN|nr:DUF1905 domain-containing protein [Gordonia asplenii]NMO00678.1 DUF1905 domain-containing protein [Gordonia asplenii]
MIARSTPNGTFDAAVWTAQSTGAWHFVSLPTELADEISDVVDHSRPGFGSVRVSARIGETTWATSIFPDAKRRTYVLPVKKAVRTAEGIVEDDVVTVHIDLG